MGFRGGGGGALFDAAAAAAALAAPLEGVYGGGAADCASEGTGGGAFLNPLGGIVLFDESDDVERETVEPPAARFACTSFAVADIRIMSAKSTEATYRLR